MLLLLLLLLLRPAGVAVGSLSQLRLVPASTPSLVAEATTLLYYPLLQHVFNTSTRADGEANRVAILLRAQTSADVDVPCADATFVSSDGARSWRATTPETGHSKFGPHVQKRVCYPYPPSSRGETALCLPYARDAARDAPGLALTADFAGTLWRLNATTGVLAPVEGEVDTVMVRFSDPYMALGSRRYTDGNAIATANGSGWLLTLYATAGVHKQAMPLSVHIYHSTDMRNWEFRSRIGLEYCASENWIVRLKDSRIMLVFRSELPQRKLFQAFSSDEGKTWTQPSTLSGIGPGGDPHAVEPKLVRLAGVGALVLSSGRAGQYVWFADEEAIAPGGGTVPIEAAEWQSFDIQAHHDLAFNSSNPEYCFASGLSTGYSSLSALPDGQLVVAYDRMPAGQPHGSPPASPGKDRIFSLRFNVTRADPPPPPAPLPPWSPNATCQAQADAWCTQNCLDKIAGHTPSCGHGPMVARCSTAADGPVKSPPRWRCYGVSTLSPDRKSFRNGTCYCSMTAGIEQALGNSISNLTTAVAVVRSFFNRYGWYVPQIADFQDTLR
jgi:hypothetical protein